MRAIVLVIGAIGFGACHDLPALGVCGNGIIEAENGEACDGDSAGADTCNEACELSCQSSAVATTYVVVGHDAATDPPSELFCPSALHVCGLDNVCRVPSGVFGPTGRAQPFAIAFATIGDFDGDRVADLIGTTANTIAVRFGGGVAPLSDGFEQDVPTADSPVAVFDSDPGTVAVATSDLAIGVPSDGFAMLVSDTESFDPELDVSFELDDAQSVDVVVVDPDPQFGDVVVAVANPMAGGALDVTRIAIAPLLPAATYPQCGGANSRLVGVAVARDRRSFVVVGRTGLSAWFACTYTPTGTTFSQTLVAVVAPPPETVVLANIDDDACAELVTIRKVGANSVVEFLDSVGAGCVLQTTTTAVQGVPSGSQSLLASGAIAPSPIGVDRDELVLASGVYRVTGSLGTATLGLVASPTSRERPWSCAVVVDLNRDGDGDVVAGRDATDGIDVVRGGTVPNVYRVDTIAPITAAVAGDFDGDFLGDAALVEANGFADRVTILYGASDGLVGPSHPNSRFEGTLQIARLARSPWGRSTRGDDGIDDLLVARTQVGKTRGGVLIGESSRTLTMPRFPIAPLGESMGALVVGQLDGARLVAGAVRPIDTGTSAKASELLLYDLLTQAFSARTLAGFEVDTLVPPQLLRTAGTPLIATLSIAIDAATPGSIRVFRSDGTVCADSPVATGALHPADVVGGDGVDELVRYLGPGDDRQVHVFGILGAVPCAIGSEVLADQLVGCVDVVRVGSTVVALCEKVTKHWGLFRLVDGVREPDSFAEFEGLGERLVVGDFDGDAIEDLAVMVLRAGALEVQFVRQCAAHDTRGCQ